MEEPMLKTVVLAVPSVLIGYGTSSICVGIGVWVALIVLIDAMYGNSY